jgi:hypothetical protein
MQAQYISEVMEYTPAPGQFINTSPWGQPQSAFSIEGGVNGTLCLGAFGGSVVFRFEQPVVNHPDNPFGVDFTIFGNPAADWSEPGIVWVMEDVNGNGAPDDLWYELAGSDFHFSSTIRDYQVTYTNPGNEQGKDIPWADRYGNTGFILANTAHLQPYYPSADSFPDIPEEGYTLSGSKITGAVDVDHPPILRSAERAFGYVDNRFRGNSPYTVPDNPYTPGIENSGGDAFDISWAVDRDGNYIDLDSIHFIKVQNALLHEGGWLGEVSTEITGAVDVEPDKHLTGNLEMVVVKDLPEEIHTTELQLEVFVFYQGRLQTGRDVSWTTSADWATVNEGHLLTASGSGPLTLTASLTGNPLVRTSVSTVIHAPNTSSPDRIKKVQGMSLYPNPASELIHLSGAGDAIISILDLSGKTLKQVRTSPGHGDIRISELPAGVYLVRAEYPGRTDWCKLLKE